jgi:hypothetical protein
MRRKKPLRRTGFKRKPKSPEKFAAQYGSEEYVLHLKLRPCDRCGVRGYSSAAHTEGGGMGMKAGPETLCSLCEDRPGTVGCHTLLDERNIEDERPALQMLARVIYAEYHREAD